MTDDQFKKLLDAVCENTRSHQDSANGFRDLREEQRGQFSELKNILTLILEAIAKDDDDGITRKDT